MALDSEVCARNHRRTTRVGFEPTTFAVEQCLTNCVLAIVDVTRGTPFGILGTGKTTYLGKLFQDVTKHSNNTPSLKLAPYALESEIITVILSSTCFYFRIYRIN